MRSNRTAWLLAPALFAACAGNPDRQTLARLHDVEPDMKEVQIENGIEQAMVGYQQFLEETPESALTPEAMRRLADLKIEKQYGLLGDGDRSPRSDTAATPPPAAPATDATAASATLPTPAPPEPHAIDSTPTATRPPVAGLADHSESEAEFEARASGAASGIEPQTQVALDLPGSTSELAPKGPLEAIELYDRILERYPDYPHNDQVLYQKARAFDELGRNDEAIAVIARLIAEYPHSRYVDEVQFRRAEYFFTRRKYLDAEEAYAAVTAMGPASQFYELALYKLGWTLYKQELHEEALDQYVALLDYKVSTGYDFDQSTDETDERRIADTYRVISLSFSNIGGSRAVEDYFAAKGSRTYEDRIYSHLGEFYLEKLRYNDAAMAYKTFVAHHPLHRSSPHFGMRVVEIYEAGGFPRLVLQSKKEFAKSYGLQSEYWHHFNVADAPEVLRYLRGNLEDLASHYHALYQDEQKRDEQPANFAEALHWYREYLASFPEDPQTPAIHHQLANLLLENRDFGDAAREYERTAYDYPEHEQSAEAGYAAIFAHREHQKAAPEPERESVRRAAVASTLRFVDTFPTHEHASVVLGAAVDDLYDMKEYERAITTGRRLIVEYPEADPLVLRESWAAVANSHFDLDQYAEAELAYASVLAMTEVDEPTYQAVVDNLAAAIYKQGEQANAAEDYRAAANHFLRVKQSAPTSQIRPAAEYDAGAALIHLEDWTAAAAVLEDFRRDHPDHELHDESTKQIASIYRAAGDLARSAEEYERVSEEADDDELRREALLLAGQLYADAGVSENALTVYLRYVKQFPKPLETAVETRYKIAAIHETNGDEASRLAQLEKIVTIDRKAGSARTDRIRYLAAHSALVLTEPQLARFNEIELVQPFDEHLRKKQKRMDQALAAFEELIDYEVGDVTAAATFYIAQVYREFSRALMESERPEDLGEAELLDYEMVLEEEAYPFEERAIEVHEKNLELMSVGVYNAWIERSLDQLAILMPGRYAKAEQSSGLIASIDRYSYKAPTNAPEPAAVDAPELDSPEPDALAAPELDAPEPAAPALDALPTSGEPAPEVEPTPEEAPTEELPTDDSVAMR